MCRFLSLIVNQGVIRAKSFQNVFCNCRMMLNVHVSEKKRVVFFFGGGGGRWGEGLYDHLNKAMSLRSIVVITSLT